MAGIDATRADILALERERLRSLVEVDMAVARALHAFDYQLITPGGAPMGRDEYLDAIESRELDYTMFEPEAEDAVSVRVHRDVAAVRYVARIVVAFPGGTDDARVWHTDLWERGEDGWQATWSHATRIPAEAP